jgi:transposase
LLRRSQLVEKAQGTLNIYNVTPSQGSVNRSHRINRHRDFILASLETKPDMTRVQLREALNAKTGELFSDETIYRFCKREGKTLKKGVA